MTRAERIPVGRSLDFERLADEYDETRGGEPRGDTFAAAILPFLDAARPALEVGAGTGVVSLGLSKRGMSMFGVDLSFGMIRRARDRLGPRVAVGDAMRLPIATRVFDQALSVWVLHVVGDVAAVLREVSRVLSHGGRYLVVPGWNGLGLQPGDPVGAMLWEMEMGLRGELGIRNLEEEIAASAPDTGLRIVERIEMPSFGFEEAPADTLRAIETRSYSTLWRVDDDMWRRFVEPVVVRLREMPDPEVPVARAWPDRLIVLEKQA